MFVWFSTFIFPLLFIVFFVSRIFVWIFTTREEYGFSLKSALEGTVNSMEQKTQVFGYIQCCGSVMFFPIPDPTFFPSRIQGSKRHRTRIRNTGYIDVQEFHLWILIPKTGEPRDTILVCRDGRLEVTAVLAALAYPELASAAPRHGRISPQFAVLRIHEISGSANPDL